MLVIKCWKQSAQVDKPQSPKRDDSTVDKFQLNTSNWPLIQSQFEVYRSKLEPFAINRPQRQHQTIRTQFGLQSLIKNRP